MRWWVIFLCVSYVPTGSYMGPGAALVHRIVVAQLGNIWQDAKTRNPALQLNTKKKNQEYMHKESI